MSVITRVSNNYTRTVSVTNMIDKLGWESLESRRKKSRPNLMNKIVGGRVAMSLKEYITRGNTRTKSINSDKFKLYVAPTLVFKNSFFLQPIPVWNKITKSIISDIKKDSSEIVNMLD